MKAGRVDTIMLEQQNVKKRTQVKQACVNCQRSHTRCENQRPCKRCQHAGMAQSCIDVPRKRRRLDELKDDDSSASSSPTGSPMATDSPALTPRRERRHLENKQLYKMKSDNHFCLSSTPIINSPSMDFGSDCSPVVPVRNRKWVTGQITDETSCDMNGQMSYTRLLMGDVSPRQNRTMYSSPKPFTWDQPNLTSSDNGYTDLASSGDYLVKNNMNDYTTNNINNADMSNDFISSKVYARSIRARIAV
eukprot:TRINITY_DN11218_c0_g1_i1.p1 TRINITY_DN11218_c0_g1~~TRINITY_DN11218_c0_g1_i1.p1  ORF type:complete len:248 (+),score=39.82 TRINITY_DN11218_c0_g1_i1:98-841(+)